MNMKTIVHKSAEFKIINHQLRAARTKRSLFLYIPYVKGKNGKKQRKICDLFDAKLSRCVFFVCVCLLAYCPLAKMEQTIFDLMSLGLKDFNASPTVIKHSPQKKGINFSELSQVFFCYMYARRMVQVQRSFT